MTLLHLTFNVLIEQPKAYEYQSIPRTLLYSSRSVDYQTLRVGVKYYIVHMYSMPYYTYGSTANLLALEPTALIYLSKEQHCNNEALHYVGRLKIERVIDSYGDFSEGQLNANSL